MKIYNNEEFIEWHKKAFPNATMASQIEKLEEEMKELEKAGESDAVEELADVLICCMVLGLRFDCTFATYLFNAMLALICDEPDDRVEILNVVQAKINKNVARKWVEVKPGYYRHKDG